MDPVKEIAEAIGKLPADLKPYLLIELFQTGKVDFVDVAKAYVKVLENSNRKMYSSINTLGLMLGSYCMHDNSPGGKNARRHLYESGAYTEKDGSGFGRMLFEEFNNTDIK